MASIFVLLLAANGAAWLWAVLVAWSNPVFLGAALLAYVFGLRHAVDADHIAAIDNVTRRLMQDGRRPATVGLWFSLGHSTVVIVACAAICLMSSAFRERIFSLAGAGALVGPVVSSGFLFLIAAANLASLRSVWRAWRAPARDALVEPAAANAAPGGLLSRLLRPMMGLISSPWRMYPLGLLFGLSFDTATEVGLLGLSVRASQAAPLAAVMVLPALFTAGMALVDTTDAVLMTKAYGWAFVRPERKLAYNFTVTLVSILVAFVIGTIEAASLIGANTGLAGGFWKWTSAAAAHFSVLGLGVIALFATGWLASVLAARVIPYRPRPAGATR